MPIEYITTRDLTNNKGETAGNIRIAKLTEEKDAQVVFKCPECGSDNNRKEPWGEPFVIGAGSGQKFIVKCSGCSYQAKLLRLKKEIKKKTK